MQNSRESSPKKQRNNQSVIIALQPCGGIGNPIRRPSHRKSVSPTTKTLTNADIYLKNLLSTFLSQISPEEEKEEKGVILSTKQKINQSKESMNKDYSPQSKTSSLHLSKTSNNVSSSEYRDVSDRSSTRVKMIEPHCQRKSISKKEEARVEMRKESIDKECRSEKVQLLPKKKFIQRLNSTKLQRGMLMSENSGLSPLALKKKSSFVAPRLNSQSSIALGNFQKEYKGDIISTPSKHKNNDNNEYDIQNVKGLTKANKVELERICQELKINICNSELGNINELTDFKEYPELRKVEKKVYANDITSNTPSSKSSKELKYRCLLRKKFVYDSLDDEEFVDEIDVSIVIPPNSKLIILFDFIVFGTVASTFIYTPYSLSLCYDTHIQYSFIEIIFEVFFDIILSMDIILRFFRSYTTNEDEVISHLPAIAAHYLTSWFLLDAIAALPLNSYIAIKHNLSVQETTHFPLEDYMPSRLYQLLRLIRMIKVINVISKNEFLRKAHRKFFHFHHFSQWSRLYLSIIIFLITVHILASLFIFIGKLNHPSWISVSKDPDSPGVIYINAIYYILSSIYSIGYGDLVSVSFSERIYNLFLLIFGVMIYSWGLSSISTYVQTQDAKTIDYNHRLRILEDIKMSHEKMPDELYDKVVRFLYYRKKNEKNDKTAIIDSLPIGLRNNLICTMYKPIIDNFTFFRNFDNTEFIVRIILALRPIYGVKHDVLVKEGDFIEEIIFVKKGKLSLQLPLPDLTHLEQRKPCYYKRNLMFNQRIKESLVNLERFSLNILDSFSFKVGTHENIEDLQADSRQYIKIMEIRTNEHFGDVLMFLNRRSPLTMKVKSRGVDMFYLKKTDAVEISMGYPSIWHTINKKSLFNMEQIDRLINKAIKLFFLSNQRQLNALIREKNKISSIYPRKEIMKSKKISELYAIVNNNNSCELKSIPSNTCSHQLNSEKMINLTEDSVVVNNHTKRSLDNETIEEQDDENTVELSLEEEKRIMAHSLYYKASVSQPKQTETELTHITFDNNDTTSSPSNLLLKSRSSAVLEIHFRESFTLQSAYCNFNEHNSFNLAKTAQMVELIMKYDRSELLSRLNRSSSKISQLKIPVVAHNESNHFIIRSNSFESKDPMNVFKSPATKGISERIYDERPVLNQREVSKWKFNQAKTKFFNRMRTDVSEDSSGKLINRKSSLFDRRNGNISNQRTNVKLNKIKENIEMNALNLNNPELFYSEYFQKVMSKEQNLIAKQELLKRLDYTEKLICENSSSNESKKKKGYDKR